jgi:HSP20 family protein
MTTLVRTLNTRPAVPSQSEISRLFNTFFDSATPLSASPLTQPSRSFVPALDIVEHADEYVLHADLPGLTEADVKIEIMDDVMTISGERKLERQETGEGYRRIERASGSFSRQLNLPKGVDASAIHAGFANGVLEIHVPKPAEAKPQVVEISTAS